MEARIRKLGTLYSGTELIGSKCNLASSKGDHPRDLIIRDTVPGLEITWVEYDGLLMAQYPVLCKISFDDLKFAGLIHDKKVQIDGVRYELRLLRGVGARGAEGRGGCLEECRFPLLGIPLPGAWLLLLRRRPHCPNRLRQPYLDGSAAHRYAH